MIFDINNPPLGKLINVNIVNKWYAEIGDRHFNVFAGSDYNDPQQGVVYVAIFTASGSQLPDGGYYPTATRSGAVHVVGAQGQRLILLSKGGQTLYFDVAGQQFTASLTQMVPTATPWPITPRPTSTPTFTDDAPNTPNDIRGLSPVNTTLNFTISPSGDEDWFRFNLPAPGTIDVRLANLPANYDLYVYSVSQPIGGKTTQMGTMDEIVTISNAPADDYIVRVVGVNGAFDSTHPYQLRFNIPVASTPSPTATPTGSAPQTATLQVAASADDVNEDGATYTDNQIAVFLGNSASASSYTGLRFNNLPIPPGSTITSATLQVYSAQTTTTPVSLQLAAEASDNAATFSSSSRPSQRALTTARVTHTTTPAWTVQTWYDFDQIAPVVQEVVNRPGWHSGSSLALILQGSGSPANQRYVAAFDGSPTFAPKLVISYIPPASGTATPTPAPTSTPSATPANPPGTFAIAQGSDDANEDGAGFSTLYPVLWFGNGDTSTASYLGLRFTNVTVPPGATITSAKLQVYSSQAQWIAVSAQFAAEASDNPQPFAETSRPSQRSLTTARVNHASNVSWSANTWYDLDDLSPVIQEMVNRPGWHSGSTLALIVKGTGAAYGRKLISSYDGDPAHAPRLVITYTGP